MDLVALSNIHHDFLPPAQTQNQEESLIEELAMASQKGDYQLMSSLIAKGADPFFLAKVNIHDLQIDNALSYHGSDSLFDRELFALDQSIYNNYVEQMSEGPNPIQSQLDDVDVPAALLALISGNDECVSKLKLEGISLGQLLGQLSVNPGSVHYEMILGFLMLRLEVAAQNLGDEEFKEFLSLGFDQAPLIDHFYKNTFESLVSKKVSLKRINELMDLFFNHSDLLIDNLSGSQLSRKELRSALLCSAIEVNNYEVAEAFADLRADVEVNAANLIGEGKFDLFKLFGPDIKLLNPLFSGGEIKELVLPLILTNDLNYLNFLDSLNPKEIIQEMGTELIYKCLFSGVALNGIQFLEKHGLNLLELGIDLKDLVYIIIGSNRPSLELVQYLQEKGADLKLLQMSFFGKLENSAEMLKVLKYVAEQNPTFIDGNMDLTNFNILPARRDIVYLAPTLSALELAKETLNFLSEQKVQLQSIQIDGQSLLMNAITKNYPASFIHFLLELGMNPNEVHEELPLIYHVPILKGHYENVFNHFKNGSLNLRLNTRLGLEKLKELYSAGNENGVYDKVLAGIDHQLDSLDNFTQTYLIDLLNGLTARFSCSSTSRAIEGEKKNRKALQYIMENADDKSIEELQEILKLYLSSQKV